jgi:hypothetical protein
MNFDFRRFWRFYWKVSLTFVLLFLEFTQFTVIYTRIPGLFVIAFFWHSLIVFALYRLWAWPKPKGNSRPTRSDEQLQS